jgi:hypothetical protein
VSPGSKTGKYLPKWIDADRTTDALSRALGVPPIYGTMSARELPPELPPEPLSIGRWNLHSSSIRRNG